MTLACPIPPPLQHPARVGPVFFSSGGRARPEAPGGIGKNGKRQPENMDAHPRSSPHHPHEALPRLPALQNRARRCGSSPLPPRASVSRPPARGGSLSALPALTFPRRCRTSNHPLARLQSPPPADCTVRWRMERGGTGRFRAPSPSKGALVGISCSLSRNGRSAALTSSAGETRRGRKQRVERPRGESGRK